MFHGIGSNRRGLALVATLAMLSTAVLANPVDAGAGKPAPVRFATFNASLNRNNAGDLAAELAVPGSAQPDAIAEIIQRSRPDVLLINEFDYDPAALADFQTNYLSVAHGRRGADRLPVHLHRTVEHRHLFGVRLRQQRHGGRLRPQ